MSCISCILWMSQLIANMSMNHNGRKKIKCNCDRRNASGSPILAVFYFALFTFVAAFVPFTLHWRNNYEYGREYG